MASRHAKNAAGSFQNSKKKRKKAKKKIAWGTKMASRQAKNAVGSLGIMKSTDLSLLS